MFVCKSWDVTVPTGMERGYAVYDNNGGCVGGQRNALRNGESMSVENANQCSYWATVAM